MKKASETMFRIGNIITILYLVLGALLMLIGIIVCAIGGVGVAAAEGDAQAEAAAAATEAAIKEERKEAAAEKANASK